MRPQRLPMSEWRDMSEAEQLAVMRAGYTPLDRLPLDVRAEVEEMLASSPVIGPHH